MLFEGKRVYDTLEDGENLFLQGIIDTAFEEDGKWVLVDYKTDRVKSGEDLIKRYKIQMDLYKEAIQRLTGMPVKACYIYSFRLHDAIYHRLAYKNPMIGIRLYLCVVYKSI